LDEQGDEQPAHAEAPRRRLSSRRRWVSVGVLLSFVLGLAYPLYLWPRTHYLLVAVPAIRGAHPARPAVHPLPVQRLAAAEALVSSEVRRGGFPGAGLAVGVRGEVLLEEGFGRVGWGRLSRPVDADATLYDLASLTKLVATTTAVMVLVDDGRMHLDDRVSRWLPHFSGGGREKVTIRQLLTHTAGLPAARPLEGAAPGDRLYNLVATVKLIEKPGTAVLYSDVGFVILGLAAGRAAGEPLPAFLRRRVWQPLGMNATRFEPGLGCALCAPTLTLDDGTPFAGRTNDPFSRELGGITGNAGLFSTTHDVGRFAAMLANDGELEGVRVVRASTLRAFRQLQPHAGTRALGFEWFCREGTVPDHIGCKKPYAYGHTGYTGTSLWADPVSGTWVVLLSNRSYLPKAPNQIQGVRRKLFNLLTGIAPAPVAKDNDSTEER
jgi:CubicO group peptidase (beta-lactamase class C family)